MKLVIVESPTKAKKIGQVLGSGYVVKASYGHIVDLPVSGLGVDLDTMEETYGFLKKTGYVDARQTVKALKDLAKTADEIFLASDPDREGEAISWHLKRELGIKSYKRIEIKEITAKGIKEALGSPRQINNNWVEAQRSRRVIDRLLGYGISPALSRSIDGAKSAGRVQSAALHLLVGRDREIAAFKPENRFSIEGTFKQGTNVFSGFLQETEESVRLSKPVRDQEDGPVTGRKLVSSTSLDLVLKELQKMGPGSWSVTSIESTPTSVRVPAPLITSTMMQNAAKAFGWTSERTMKAAQALFENGHITYHRTDSLRASDESIQEAREWIVSQHGDKYVPAKPNVFKNKDGAQDGHECVRPSHIEVDTVALDGREGADATTLYTMIREAFLCSQASPGENLLTKITISENGHRYQFLSSASVVKFDGWRKMRSHYGHDAEAELGAINKGLVQAENFDHKATTTKPPPHYKEDTMLKDLEKLGIGRPSSWANVTKTLQGRTYIETKGRDYLVTKLGFKADDWLTSKAPQYTDAGYTSKMEDDLDLVEAGKKARVPLLNAIREDLEKIFGKFGSFGGGGGVSDKMKSVLDSMRAAGESVPDTAWTDPEVCKPILDAFFAGRKPSEKQISFARDLSKKAEDNGNLKLAVTDEILASAELTKKYITKMLKATKDMTQSYPDKAATPKQVDYAKSLAQKAGVAFDESLIESFQAISKFIESLKGGSSPAPAKKPAARKKKTVASSRRPR